jgi:hypothetical protein
MNTRRSFFKQCATFVAGCALGVGLSTAKLKATDTFEVTTETKILKLNPEYVNAPYEIQFLLDEKQLIPVFVKRSKDNPVTFERMQEIAVKNNKQFKFEKAIPFRLKKDGKYIDPFIQINS